MLLCVIKSQLAVEKTKRQGPHFKKLASTQNIKITISTLLEQYTHQKEGH